MIIQGNVLKYGDNINTDLIIPGKYLHILDPEKLSCYAMHGIDPAFSAKVITHSILVVGSHFGCGSSREQAAICLNYAGVQAIVAKSFARIFFRNAINQGIAVVESPEAYDVFQQDDCIEIDFTKGSLYQSEKNLTIRFKPLPTFLQDIIESKGLLLYLKTHKGKDISTIFQ